MRATSIVLRRNTARLPGFSDQRPWVGYDNNNTGRINGFTGEQRQPARNPYRSGLIDPYLKSDGVKWCPAKPKAWQIALATNWFNASTGSAYYSRDRAAQGNEWGPMAKEIRGVSGLYSMVGANASEVHEPSYTLLLWEHAARVPMCNFMQSWDWYDSPPNDNNLRNHFNFLHRSGASTIWADGHTSRILYMQLRRPMFSSLKSHYPDY